MNIDVWGVLQMSKPKSSVRKTLVTNICLAVIILLVWFAAFGPLQGMFETDPALRGSTGEAVVGLQILVTDGSDVEAYMDTLKAYGVKATFFFPDTQTEAMADNMLAVMAQGHGVGYYITGRTRASALYLGGGYSIPVMGYAEGGAVREVCPSIDVSKLSLEGGWTDALADALAGDMFVCVRADNNFNDFEKVVQIVLDKGYTILKVNEML